MNGTLANRMAQRYVVDRESLAHRLSAFTEGLPDVLAGWLPWAVAGAVRDGLMDCVPTGPTTRDKRVVDLRQPATPVEDDLYRETIRYVCGLHDALPRRRRPRPRPFPQAGRHSCRCGMTRRFVPVALPFDYKVEARLKSRDRDQTYVVRERFETLVEIFDERTGDLVVKAGNGRAEDLVLPIVGSKAFHPASRVAERDYRATADRSALRPEEAEAVVQAALDAGNRFKWAVARASPVRLSSDGTDRQPYELLTRDFLDRRMVSKTYDDRDARLAAAIAEASQLAVIDGGLHTALREPVVMERGHPGFLDIQYPWSSHPEIRECHTIETVLASSGRRGATDAGYDGDLELVEGRIDDLLLNFDILAGRLQKRTVSVTNKASDATFASWTAALGAIRNRRMTKGSDAHGLAMLVRCAEGMTKDGVGWGSETSGGTPEMVARLKHHYLSGVSGTETDDDAWLEGISL
jgi:hypothetical protein